MGEVKWFFLGVISSGVDSFVFARRGTKFCLNEEKGGDEEIKLCLGVGLRKTYCGSSP